MRQFNMPNRRCAAILLATLMFAAYATIACAETQSKGPSTSSPRNALLVTFYPRLGDWRNECLKATERIEIALKELESADDDIGKVEETKGDIIVLGRLGRILMAFGEPAGVDFETRSKLYDAALLDIATKMVVNPAAKRSIQRRNETLERVIASAKKKLSKVTPAAKRRDYIAACEGLYRLMDPLDQQGLWWTIINGRRHASMIPWDNYSLKWFTFALQQYKADALTLATKGLKENSINYEAFLKAIDDAAQTIAASGSAELSTGTSVSGPQAVEYFGKAWVNIQLRALRRRSFARLCMLLGSDLQIDEDARHSEFCGKVAASLTKIINADAKRTTADEAPRLHDEYLQKLPPVISRSPELNLASTFGPALNELAEKSTELSADLKLYRASTSDLLRWRERTAAAYTRARQKNFESLAERLQSARRASGGLLAKGSKGGTVAGVYTSVPAMIDEASKVFMEKDFYVSDLIVSRRNGSFAISPLVERSISYVPIPSQALEAAYGHLGADLFAPGGAVAPTLEAQMAIYTARQGDLQAAGGKVLNIGLVGWAARYALLNEDDRGLVRPGPLPEEKERIRQRDLVVLFMIKPSWLAHRHFFVSLDAP